MSTWFRPVYLARGAVERCRGRDPSGPRLTLRTVETGDELVDGRVEGHHPRLRRGSVPSTCPLSTLYSARHDFNHDRAEFLSLT